jgi:long-chain fatty acid transport protein
MKRSVKLGGLSAAISGVLLASAPAHAITDVEANSGPQFNFINPGARSLGMAGAFLGMADDSTAAYTNPAGLGQLVRREFVVEGRYTEFNTLSVRSGRLMGTPTGIGLDTVSGLQTQETSREIANISFLSYALPLEHGTVAAYRHELANFEASFSSLGPFIQTTAPAGSPPPPLVHRVLPSASDIDLKIVNYGLAGSWRVHPKLMIGGSLNYYVFDYSTETRRYTVDTTGDGVTLLELLSVADLSPALQRDRLTQNGFDGDWGFNLGMLWQPNDAWSVGAVYRKSPTFNYDYTVERVNLPILFHGETDFRVPDMFGIGVGFRPSDAWRVSLDVARMRYSQHADHVVSHGTGNEVDFLGLSDTTEVRIGAEYTNAEATHPYSIRFGVWHEPAHQLEFDGTLTPYAGTPLTAAQNSANAHAAIFAEGEDSWHITAGYGVVFKKFQVDLAADHSDRTDTLSASLVYYFE